MTTSRIDFENFNIIDLSHTLHSEIPHWAMNPGDKGIELETETDYTVGGICSQKIKAYLRAGTHYDAPAHFYQGAPTIDQLEPTTLMGPCVMIDVSANLTENYKITVNDVYNFEAQHGAIPADSIAVFYTGWEQYWTSNPEKYRDTNSFPSLDLTVGQLLLSKNVNGIGTDTVSVDRPNPKDNTPLTSDDFPVHKLWLGAGKYLIENMHNINQLPPTGGQIVGGPLKIKNATEAPARIWGLKPKSTLFQAKTDADTTNKNNGQQIHTNIKPSSSC